MSRHEQTDSPFTEPFAHNWTIEALLEWFADDDTRLSDVTLRAPLRDLEEAMTGTRWTLDLDASLTGARLTREPAIVSLVRSIALHVSRHPALRAHTVAEVLRHRTPIAETVVSARAQRQITRPLRSAASA
ncbi:hypothetical protein ACI7YT_01750 [Microbacterium sp. M]|uniref:hypothetical protein n=1 Tax=Microbacterium sp. M TaxID=3377125 RepID=UPI0038639776